MAQTAKNIESRHPVNGVEVDKLFGTIDAIKKTPVIATFKFRASNRDRGRPHSLRPLTPPGIRSRTGRFM